MITTIAMKEQWYDDNNIEDNFDDEGNGRYDGKTHVNFHKLITNQ